jgi:hypothetical protein
MRTSGRDCGLYSVLDIIEHSMVVKLQGGSDHRLWCLSTWLQMLAVPLTGLETTER